MSQDQQSKNDIDQILNEVEELRRELSTGAEAINTQAVAKEIADHLSAEAPVADAVPAAEQSSAPTLAQATEVAKELAAVADLTKEMEMSAPLDLPVGEESMESTLAELKDDPSVKTLLDQTLDDQARRQTEPEAFEPEPFKENPMANNSDPESAPSLTMSLTGSMTLRLKYEFAGQEVTVGFTDEYLKVELADGTEFKIPVGRQKALRRVA